MNKSCLRVVCVLMGISVVVGQFDKNKAIGPCINHRCPEGHVCHEDECFAAPPPQPNDDSMNDMFGDDGPRNQPIGPCINNLCPAGYTCNQSDYKCY